MKEVVVSICCLAFNHEKYIRQCLEGFIMQKTNFIFEVLIHDDSSTDKTAEIIREYEVKYPEIIKPIYQTENQYSKGIAVSSTYNWSRAKGKYIAMCEGDDYWTDPLKLQKQVDFLEKNKEYGMVHTNFDTYYQNKNYFLKNTHSVYNIDIKDDCTLDYWNLFGKAMATIKTLTVCFRYDLLKKWQSVTPENKWLIGDFPLYFYISLQSKVGYINESTSVYRTVPQGSVSNVGNDIKKKLNLKKTYVDIRLHFLEKYNLDESKYQQAFIRDLNLFFDCCIIAGNKVILNEYFEIIQKLNLEHLISNISKVYLKSKSNNLNYFLQFVTKIKLLILTYLFKLFNLKFLSSTFKRKLKFKNV
jgi:glycosyltransferase involved in cell wall biosynthesis